MGLGGVCAVPSAIFAPSDSGACVPTLDPRVVVDMSDKKQKTPRDGVDKDSTKKRTKLLRETSSEVDSPAGTVTPKAKVPQGSQKRQASTAKRADTCRGRGRGGNAANKGRGRGQGRSKAVAMFYHMTQVLMHTSSRISAAYVCKTPVAAIARVVYVTCGVTSLLLCDTHTHHH